jgi:hypothetical protein
MFDIRKTPEHTQHRCHLQPAVPLPYNSKRHAWHWGLQVWCVLWDMTITAYIAASTCVELQNSDSGSSKVHQPPEQA